MCFFALRKWRRFRFTGLRDYFGFDLRSGAAASALVPLSGGTPSALGWRIGTRRGEVWKTLASDGRFFGDSPRVQWKSRA
jgi:hypothetical protein